MRVLITGGSGLVGRNLRATYAGCIGFNCVMPHHISTHLRRVATDQHLQEPRP